MSTSKIQKGDKVKVIAGSFKGHLGEVVLVQKRTKNRKIQKKVAVAGIKKLSKFRKKVVYQGSLYPGQITEKDRLIDISNVALVDSKGKATKVKIQKDQDGKTFRVLKSDNSKLKKEKKKVKKTKKSRTDKPKENKE